MMVNIIMFCLMGAVFANPISFNAVLESNELDSNSTESLSVSQSSENGTSELLSSEESSSNQSQSSESSSESESDSESTESTSEDKTQEESNSLLDENDVANPVTETTDNSMGSEENIRKSWVQVFATVIRVQSEEDNSSTEVKGQSDQLTQKTASYTSTDTTIRQGADTQLPLVENPADSSETTSDSANTSEGAAASTDDSSESTSSESNETSDSSDSSDTTSDGAAASTNNSSESTSSESNETSDSSDTSTSVEESNAGGNALLGQLETKDCANGTQSCESEEYLLTDIGDDAHYSVDSLMVPDDDERELGLRR